MPDASWAQHTRSPNGFLLRKAFQSDYAPLYSVSDALTGKWNLPLPEAQAVPTIYGSIKESL
jgi:hypothetical protein